MSLRSRPIGAALLALLAFGATACAPDVSTSDSPTAPPSAFAAADQTANLEATLHQERTRLAAAAARNEFVFDSLMRVQPGGPPQKLLGGLIGTVGGLLGGVTGILFCKPQEYAYDSKVIGPEGGYLRLGIHRLTIPPKALKVRTVISGEVVSGSNIHVKFKPHGLVFTKGITPTLALSYSECGRTLPQPKAIAYVDDQLKVLEVPLSRDDPRKKVVYGFIEHFSGYLVAFRADDSGDSRE